MEGVIFSVKRFAVHDGDGIRTTVFFKGCPLRCAWCHNPEGLLKANQLAFMPDKCISCGECAAACPVSAHIIDSEKQTHVLNRDACILCGKCAKVCLGDALTYYGERVSVEKLLPRLLEDREFFASSGGGVTLSGGECLEQYAFCSELLAALKEENINTAIDTCGFVPREALDAVLPYTDTFLYDIKAFHKDVHIRCTSQSNRLILENLKYLDSVGAAVEIRMPFVPGYNDGEVGPIAEFLSGFSCITKLRVLPYHRYALSKYESLAMPANLPEVIPSKEQIAQAEACFRSYGLTVV